MFDYLEKTIENGKRRVAELEKMAEDAKAQRAELKRQRDEDRWQRVVSQIDAAFERFEK